MLNTNGKFMPGSYGQEIHEMVEARAVAMGQVSVCVWVCECMNG